MGNVAAAAQFRFRVAADWNRVVSLRADLAHLRSLTEEMIEWLKRSGHPVKAGECQAATAVDRLVRVDARFWWRVA